MGYENYIEHNWGKRGLPHKHPANGLNYTAHYPLERVDEMMTSKEWTRATFVRDPKERALSAYLMLKPTITVEDNVLEKARLGLYNQSKITKNNNTVDLIRKLYPKMGSPQIVNCCRKRKPRILLVTATTLRKGNCTSIGAFDAHNRCYLISSNTMHADKLALGDAQPRLRKAIEQLR